MKRILALDGGGIRGVFTLQILARIEELLREEHGRRDLVLADVVDMFAGTSTGAIIAAFLSWGLPVCEIERLYVARGPQMFSRVAWHRRLNSKYRAETIADFFREFFYEEAEGVRTAALLESRRLRGTLLVVMRNASTGSPWPVSNNPGARFNDAALPDCNLKIPLWQLLRASTAAPTYFPPEQIRLGAQQHVFVDGGVTPFNNPSLIAVLMATLPQYRMSWPSGRESLHVTSVGTGSVRHKLPRKVIEKINIVDQVRFTIPALIGSVSAQQDMLCRVLGDCVYGDELDLEVGSLHAPTLLPPQEQKFTYARYDLRLDAAKSMRGRRALSGAETELDNVKLIPLLQKIGRQYAAEHVRLDHLHGRASRM
jgi:patatin-like phospholipase/acyl hydrolase